MIFSNLFLLAYIMTEEIIMLRKTSQSEKDKYYLASFICEIYT
jgi:hypothetical protein